MIHFCRIESNSFRYEIFDAHLDVKYLMQCFVFVTCSLQHLVCGCLCQVILDFVTNKEFTIRRLLDEKFSQPGIGVISRVNDSPHLKPLFV